MKTYKLANPLQHGSDLKQLQRALKKAKLYLGPLDGIFGAGMAHSCKDAKWKLGYPKRAVLPTGGQTLLDYLQDKKPLPAAYRARRRLRGYGLSKADLQRKAIVKWAKWGILNAADIGYTQSAARDDFLRYPAGHLPMNTDCSGWVTACYRWGNAKDPNGLNFRAVGFTGTLLDNGQTIPLWAAKPADVVIWGVAPGHHTAILLEDGASGDPLVCSHGQQSDPRSIRLSQETAAQNRPYVIKRYLGS